MSSRSSFEPFLLSRSHFSSSAIRAYTPKAGPTKTVMETRNADPTLWRCSSFEAKEGELVSSRSFQPSLPCIPPFLFFYISRVFPSSQDSSWSSSS